MALLFSATPVAPRHLACRVQRRHLTHIVRHARELSEIALKEEVTGKTFDLNTNNRVEDLPQEFSYYKNATHQIDELELLSEELDSVVSEVDQLLLTSNDLPAFTVSGGILQLATLFPSGRPEPGFRGHGEKCYVMLCYVKNVDWAVLLQFADLAHGESSFSYKAAPHSTNLTGAEQGQAAGGRVRSSASQRKPSSTRKKTTPAASEPVDEQPQLVLGSGPSLPPPSMPTVGPSLASSSHDAGMLRPARARVARNRQRVSTLPDSTADQASQHNTQATSPVGHPDANNTQPPQFHLVQTINLCIFSSSFPGLTSMLGTATNNADHLCCFAVRLTGGLNLPAREWDPCASSRPPEEDGGLSEGLPVAASSAQRSALFVETPANHGGMGAGSEDGCRVSPQSVLLAVSMHLASR